MDICKPFALPEKVVTLLLLPKPIIQINDMSQKSFQPRRFGHTSLFLKALKF